MVSTVEQGAIVGFEEILKSQTARQYTVKVASLKAFILFMPLNSFKDKCLNPYASIRKALQLMQAA